MGKAYFITNKNDEVIKNTSTEKIKKVYVLAGISNDGVTCFLKSLGGANEGWEIVTDIEYCTKAANKVAAKLMRDFYEFEMHDGFNWVIVPCEIEYRLLEEES